MHKEEKMSTTVLEEKDVQNDLTISDQALGMLFLEDVDRQLLVPSSPGNLYVTWLFKEDKE